MRLDVYGCRRAISIQQPLTSVSTMLTLTLYKANISLPARYSNIDFGKVVLRFLIMTILEPRLIFGTADKPIDSRAKRTADNRRYPEKPKLGKRPTTGKQGHAGTAGRIHGGVRHRNTN